MSTENKNEVVAGLIILCLFVFWLGRWTAPPGTNDFYFTQYTLKEVVGCEINHEIAHIIINNDGWYTSCEQNTHDLPLPNISQTDSHNMFVAEYYTAPTGISILTEKKDCESKKGTFRMTIVQPIDFQDVSLDRVGLECYKVTQPEKIFDYKLTN